MCGAEFTDEELMDAANDINNAQYGDSFYGKKNPISVTVPEDGSVIISKNNGIPGPKAREKAVDFLVMMLCL